MITCLEVIAFLYQLLLTPDVDRTDKETLAIIGCAKKLISFCKKNVDVGNVKIIQIESSLDDITLRILYAWYSEWEEEVDIVLKYLERKYHQ